MHLFWLCSVVLWISHTWATQASEVGVVDWHKPLVGIPLFGAHSTAPRFQRVGELGAKSRTLLFTATSGNILAALDPADGVIAWRYVFEDNEHVVGYKLHGDVLATVSGAGGATLRLLDAATGDLLAEKHLHKPDFGRLFDPETLGTSITFDAEGDVYVLSNAHIARRVDGKTGEVKWGWSAPDQSSLVAYSKIITTPSTVYLIGLAKSFASYTIHVTALSTATGELLTTGHIPSSISDGLTDFFELRDVKDAQVPLRIVWIEGGSVRYFGLTPELKEKPMGLKGAVYKNILDVGLSEYGQFVALKEDGTALVLRSVPEGFRQIWEFAESANSPKYTVSKYVGGLDMDGRPYIARVYWSHVYKKAVAHVFAGHLADGKGLVSGYTFPFETNVHGVISHVAVETANPDGNTIVARLAVTTSTGAIQLWQHDKLQWSREEGLADIKVAELVELPERKIITSHVGDEEESFGDRLVRQLSDAQNFPQYATNFARRFVTGSYASVSSSAAPSTNASEPLARDTFGFRKVIVAATTHGKLYGIDSADGAVLWSRVFGLGWAAEIGGQIIPVKMFVTRTVGDGDAPQVVLVTQRKASNGLVDTVLFHVDALTGEDARGVSESGDLLQGFDIIAGPIIEAYLLRSGSQKLVVLLDEFVQVHIYPETEETKEAFRQLSPSIHIPLRTGAPGQRRLTGHRISSEVDFTGKHVADITWSLGFAPGEDILSITPHPAHEPVASLGKVLGNRTTLYKYLNPNLMAVVTGSPTAVASKCSLYLVDGAKGTILYHVALPVTEGACDVKVSLTENWLVYQYYDGDASGVQSTKSHRVVSVELYEGSGIDQKTRSSDLSSFSNETAALTVFEQAFIMPRGINIMTTTSTSYGITIKDIVVANENHQIQSFPRRILDPRRPMRKPTSEEMEEWLIQYDSVVYDDPKRVLSHSYQVVGTKHVVTSPALLESTSLIFAYGHDLFFTRIAPSNTFDVLSESFNKVQLVLTIAGLALAIVITKPMVRRKRLRERWYD
ncbi:uncharacterized protein B0H18DRAFT_996604 [Fomitopsis serialis]|uniref:uncharacterized protein n=1 Tax=Fomitopsis serialis TaxID=139415 RepID=UPI00200771FE|nr:uncharacterized protein B0H18DRAFT_996604 [Neoantrodia serialis]KAH9929331.1 hypothetical protein B0H18DRAFT_996604 [Neoantrodia serialis]